MKYMLLKTLKNKKPYFDINKSQNDIQDLKFKNCLVCGITSNGTGSRD